MQPGDQEEVVGVFIGFSLRPSASQNQHNNTTDGGNQPSAKRCGSLATDAEQGDTGNRAAMEEQSSIHGNKHQQ
jgi:hypothetical protein